MVASGVFAAQPPRDLHQVGDHWTAWEPPSSFEAGADVYTIVRGDTLWDLARNYELSVRKIAHANGLTVNETLYPGQALLIPRREGEQLPASADGSVRYSVRKGDSLWTISRRFNVSIQQLRNWNRLNLRNHLKPGQVLIVRRDDPHEAREI